MTADVPEFDIPGLQNKTQEQVEFKNKLLNNSWLKDNLIKTIKKYLELSDNKNAI